ncbi:MAG: TonB-dependent receptor [Bacteroidota bacterium]
MFRKITACLLAGLTILSYKGFTQKQYSFNSPGSQCYFQYVCFTQQQNYSNAKRPFIIILGNPGQQAMDIYEADQLKNIPQFYNYMFVYVPNRGGTSVQKTQCLEAIASLVTFNYSNGRQNLFLNINDPTISNEDLKANDFSTVFQHMRLSDPASTTDTIPGNDSLQLQNTIASAFKETIVVDETERVDEEESTNTPVVAEKIQKTYFGPALAFNFTLSGIVRDKQSGEALPFATVQIKGTTTAVNTNMDGYFTFLKVPTDTTTLIVQYVGYEKTEVYLTPQLPKKNLQVQLSLAVSALKEVVVTAEKEDVVLISRTDANTIKMTPKKLEQLPNLGEKDVMRSFQLMPGVSASNESSSGLYVRGGTPDQNLILYDGFTIYHVDHLYGFFSAFNANALKDVQLYKGSFESRFGGRLSSVTEITGKDGNQKKFNIGGDLSLLSANAYVEVPVGKKFSSVIAYRRSYQGPVYNKLFDKFNSSTSTLSSNGNNGGGTGGGRRGSSQQTQPTSYFYDLNGKFTYRPTDKDIISLSIYNGSDKLDNSSGSTGGGSRGGFSITDLTKYGNIGGSLKWSRKWSPRFYGNTILSYSNYYSDRDRSQSLTRTNSAGEQTTIKSGIIENNNLKDYSFKSDYQWDIFNWSQIQFGVFGTDFDIKYNYAQNDTVTILNKNNQGLLYGGYLQTKLKFFNEKLQILPGLRASYFDVTKATYYEPRASIVYNVTRLISLKAGTGKYYQFANRVTREDILSGSRDFWILSNGKNIPVSSAIHYTGGVSVDTKNFLFSTEVYYKTLSNLTEYSLRFNTSPGGVTYNENFFNGKGFSKGVEFLIQKKTGKFNGWVSYTLAQARNNFAVYSTDYFPANQDVTHEFKIVALYEHKRWDFSATWIYATGRPYTAPSGAYSVTLLDGTTQDFFTVTSKNSLRLPDYHRMDFSVHYKLLVQGDKKKKRDIGYIGFSLFNVYNRKNVWYKQYSISDGVITETNVNYVGLIPNLTLSLKLR